MLDAAPQATRVGWCDSESYAEGSNLACWRNLRSYLNGRSAELWYETSAAAVAGERAEIVSVDGDHSHHGCLIDLGLALAMRPRLILVDDATAIPEVRQAILDFASYTRLEPEFIETTNGLAVFRPEG